MKGVILFEESQMVCKAFREMGHEFYSCDIKECSGGHPKWHFQMDIMDALYLHKWNFIGMHPGCTAMTLSGNKHYAYGTSDWPKRIQAVNWTIDLWEKMLEITDVGYMENPMGAMNGDERLPKPQIIHPYYFGDPFQKQTCLWLHNLPPLFHVGTPDLFNDKVTHTDKGKMHITKSGKVLPKWYSDAKSHKNYAELRSKTFPGPAKAMAEQWG